ncbi:hypothetical protein Ddye_026096 [Dipteronia dyeriana]|uniref:Uncharacterized protein n=1 Tax=Dipteronia dyeriana TaxID=168575 RepID=A0AAD9TM33_9ROSI|nr:hypothetical protein Ddye_026096 [Dipteronia dyeriana]
MYLCNSIGVYLCENFPLYITFREKERKKEMSSIIHGDDDDQLNLKPSKHEEDWLLAMQLVTGSVFPMVMKAAIELGLLEIMSKANPSQLSSSQIVSQLPTKNYQEEAGPSIIDRILRLLSSHSILTCSLVTTEDGHVQRFYGLAPLCKYFVPNEDGVSLAPYLLVFQDKVSMDSWHHLKESVLDGGLPFVKAHGMQGFEYAAIDGRMNKLFNEIMYNQTAFVMIKILEIYKGFEGLNQVVDIGGGLGSNLSFIVSKYPHIKAIYFDFPNVIQDAPSCPGVENAVGDIFVEIPTGQAIFMKWILHHWDDDRCLKILKNCYDALSDAGKVIVVESIVSDLPETDVVSQNICRLDMSIFTTVPGAKERTKEEFQALAAAAGFSSLKIVCRVYCYWVFELHK